MMVTSLAFVFFLCFFLSLVIVKTKSLHMGLTADTLQGVQKFHQGSVPRIGGLSIFFSLFVGTLLFDFSDLTKIKIIACFPVFVFGFIEDLFKSVPSLYRLFASLLTSILFVYLSGSCQDAK